MNEIIRHQLSNNLQMKVGVEDGFKDVRVS